MKIDATVLAITEALVQERCASQATDSRDLAREAARFVMGQQMCMPDYLRPPMRGLTILFRASTTIRCGCPFHKLPHEKRWRRIMAWKRSPRAFQRDFVKFFETLVVFAWFSARYPDDYRQVPGNVQERASEGARERGASAR